MQAISPNKPAWIVEPVANQLLSDTIDVITDDPVRRERCVCRVISPNVVNFVDEDGDHWHYTPTRPEGFDYCVLPPMAGHQLDEHRWWVEEELIVCWLDRVPDGPVSARDLDREPEWDD